MKYLSDFASSQPVAVTVLVLMIIAIAGLSLAQVKIKGIGIGVTGVLFAGIIAGHFGLHVEASLLEFLRDFGLVLFVFTIGLQLGPGFISSFRKGGIKMNALAALIVLLGAASTLAVAAVLKINALASLGLFSGATTNTPSLGATQQMLKSFGSRFADQAGVPSLAYAAAYTGGVLGIMLVILFVRFVLTNKAEKTALSAPVPNHVQCLHILVSNPVVAGVRLNKIPGFDAVVVSRMRESGSSEVITANNDALLHLGDVMLAVGTLEALKNFCAAVGRACDLDLRKTGGNITSQDVYITNKDILGETIGELGLPEHFGVTATRVTRSGIEMTADSRFRLQFGDQLKIVGQSGSLVAVVKKLGNQIQAVNETNFLPVFVGILLGVMVGMIPIAIPHLPVPVRLGMAGGPLILAILLARIGRIGPLVWYMPSQANTALREFGIILFLACVGMKAGPNFVATVFTIEGLHWLLAGLLITVLPLLVVALIARFILNFDSPTISGLLSGSMTDPPALAFAHAISGSEAPLVAYATVYPLAMLLRIFIVQIMAVLVL